MNKDPAAPDAPVADRERAEDCTSALISRMLKDNPPLARGTERGQQIGDYRLVERIGQGGMGEVWAAEQVSLQRRVAIKFVRAEHVSEKQLLYFQREARAGGRLHHPGLIGVHAYGEQDGRAWIAMELVEGGETLRDLIDAAARQAQVPADYDREVARIVAEIAEAMQTAHDAGVIHRDLKPQNVLMPADGHPKVGDFGLAKITDESALSQTGEFAGTYYYMSPEQVAARRMGIDHRADVFSLGVVLYELLALRRPFEGDTTHQIAAHILTKEPSDPRTFRSRIPRDLVVIASRALEKDRDRRYLSMGAFAADLRRHLAGEPIHARPPNTIERCTKWVRRHRSFSLLSAVIVTATTLVLAFTLRDLRTQRVLAAQGMNLLQLSAIQDLESLVARADQLWPAHPEHIQDYENWIAEAKLLVAGLRPDPAGGHEGYLALRDQLETRARGGESSEEPRALHPRYAEFEGLNAKVASMRNAREVRAGRAEPAEFTPNDRLDEEAADLILLARALAHKEHFEPGREAEALAVARRAESIVTDDRSLIAALGAHAWSAFACGLDGEALEAARQAVEIADVFTREACEQQLIDLQFAIDSAPETLAAAEAQLDALEREIAEDHPLRFASSADEWQHELLSKLVEDLEVFTDPDTGLASSDPVATSSAHGWSISRRLAFARELETLYAPGGAYDTRWKSARKRIREVYGATASLDRRIGFVPIGPNPNTGLWEFFIPQSGAEPLRGPTGELEMDEESGLALALLLGGECVLGSQEQDSDLPHYDPDANAEGPVRLVKLSPLFMAIHEMTQAQWLRLTGDNPAFLSPEGAPSGVTLLHPIETVSCNSAQRALGWLGLELPSEAQWEYACRAGSPRPWSWPADARVVRHANIGERRYSEVMVTNREVEDWDDGYGVHAPVGSFLPNAFGLYDMHGNVWEWCADGFERENSLTTSFRDPRVVSTDSHAHTIRGGGWRSNQEATRVTYRDSSPPTSSAPDRGVRAVSRLAD